MPNPSKKKATLNFEKAFSELEQMVESLESGNLKLEESVKTFEKGVALIKTCQKSLDQAEQKIQILLDKNGVSELADLKSIDDLDSDDDESR